MNTHMPRPRCPLPHRTDRHGGIWCYGCRQFLPPARFTVQRDRFGARTRGECRDCLRARNAAWRADRYADPERWRAAKEAAARSRAQGRAAIRQDRREFAQLAIRGLESRGFTIGEIARLARTDHRTVKRWRDGGNAYLAGKPVKRLAVVFRAALDLPPASPDPNPRHHHPDFWRLMAVTEDEIERVIR